MKLSINNKELIGTSKLAQIDPPAKTSPLEERNEYERYKWYVGHALLSFESILETSPDDGAWKGTFTGFICDHKKYLRSDEFKAERIAERYTEEIQRLLKDTLEKKCLEQP